MIISSDSEPERDTTVQPRPSTSQEAVGRPLNQPSTSQQAVRKVAKIGITKSWLAHCNRLLQQ